MLGNILYYGAIVFGCLFAYWCMGIITSRLWSGSLGSFNSPRQKTYGIWPDETDWEYAPAGFLWPIALPFLIFVNTIGKGFALVGEILSGKRKFSWPKLRLPSWSKKNLFRAASNPSEILVQMVAAKVLKNPAGFYDPGPEHSSIKYKAEGLEIHISKTWSSDDFFNRVTCFRINGESYLPVIKDSPAFCLALKPAYELYLEKRENAAKYALENRAIDAIALLVDGSATSAGVPLEAVETPVKMTAKGQKQR